MKAARAAIKLILCSQVVLAFVVVQWPLLRLWPAAARMYPVWIDRTLLGILGVRVVLDGELAKDSPTLIVSSHSSWIDILSIGSIGPASFVSKQEVRDWPFVGFLATLIRTIFIDRSRRQATGSATEKLAERLIAGDRMVLFPEGTSSDGNRVLPFKSAVIGAVEKAVLGSDIGDMAIQPMAVAFVRQRGLPMSRTDRHFFTWYGDMDFAPHVWGVMMNTPVEIVITVGEPLRHSQYPNRKDMTRQLEVEVRRMLLSSIMGRELATADIVPATEAAIGQTV